jgi:thymidylate synthase (FAD)
LPKDAQPEIRNLAELIFVEFEKWMPEVAAIYSKKRMGKNLLAP